MARNKVLLSTTSVKVPVNVFRTVNGEMIARDDDETIASNYRRLAETLLEKDEELYDASDEEIAAIVRAIPGDGTEADKLRAMAVYEYDGTQDKDSPNSIPPRSISAASGDREAAEYASKVDKAFSDLWSETATIDERSTGAVILFARDMMRLYKGDKSPLHMPVPGTDGRDEEKKKKTRKALSLPAGWNGPYAIRNVNLAGEAVRVDFYVAMHDDSAHGRINRDLDVLLKKLAAEGGIKNLTQSEITEFERLQVAQGALPSMVKSAMACANDSKKGMLPLVRVWNDSRRQSVIKRLRNAVDYLQRKDQIEALPGRFEVFTLDKDPDAIARRKKPLKVVYTPDKNDPNNTGPEIESPLSVLQLIRFKPWLAKAEAEKEGVPVAIGHLRGTAKRKTADKSKVKYPAIASPLEAQHAVYALLSYLESSDTVLSSIVDDCKGDEGDDKVMAYGRLGSKLDFVNAKNSPRFNRLVAAQAQKDKTEDKTEDKKQSN